MPRRPNATSFIMSLSRIFTDRRQRMRGMFGKFKSLFRHEGGSPAVEFALLSPLLAGGVLFLGMLSVDINHRIKMDHILRAGAAVAINDPGQNAVVQRMREVALSKGYSAISNQPGTVPGVLHMQSVRSCFCPEQPNGNVGCANICVNQRPTVVRYHLEAFYREPLIHRIIIALSRIGLAIPFLDPFLTAQVVVR